MQQEFDVLSLVHVFNPLYALPIVAVILCAFLVYAFGFKSPVQPPSFDELIEVDKKQSKKRKVKDNQKGKQQNGKLPGTLVKTSDVPVSSGKKKVDKSPGKSEAKAVAKKSTTTEKKKKQSTNQVSSPIIEDGNDEGWVHLVSKKGRKNKKKDETVSNSDVSRSLMDHSDITDMEILNDLQNSSSKVEESAINGCKEMVSIADIEQVVEKRSEESVKVNAKSNAPKKQRTKNKNDLVKDSGKSLCDAKIDDRSLKNGLAHSNNVESESSEVESSAASNDPMKATKEQKQPKKKKKKKHDINEKDNLDNVTSTGISALEDSIPKFPSVEIAVNSGLPTMNSHEVIDDISNQAQGSAEDKGLIFGESKDIKNGDNSVDGKGSNVAFDELEGLYPDAKVAKRRKKVRRDH